MEPSINKALEETNVDVSLLKTIIIAGAGVLSSAAFGYFSSRYFDSASAGGSFWYLVVASVLFSALFILQTIFIKSPAIINLAYLLEGLAMSAFFLNKFSLSVLGAFAGLVLFFGLAISRGRAEMENQMKVKFFRIESHILPHFFTGLALFIAIIYANSLDLGGAGISKTAVQSLFKPSEPLIQNLVVKNFSFNMTMYQFVDATLIKQLASQLGAQIDSIPASTRVQAVNDSLKALQQKGAEYGIGFKSADTVLDVVYNYILGLTKNIPRSFQPAIQAGLILIIFLAIKGVAVFVRWIAAPISYVLYELTLTFGFARITLESRAREIIIL